MRDRLLSLPGETAYMLAMRPQAECFEILDNAVRAALEEIADPAGAAARAAAESKNGEVHRGIHFSDLKLSSNARQHSLQCRAFDL